MIIHGASGGKIENMGIPRALQWNHFKPLQKKNTEDDNLKKKKIYIKQQCELPQIVTQRFSVEKKRKC